MTRRAHTPIVDACPICDAKYEWDACGDCYPLANQIELANLALGRVEAFQCLNCAAVFAFLVTDEDGQRVFVPSTKEL